LPPIASIGKRGEVCTAGGKGKGELNSQKSRNALSCERLQRGRGQGEKAQTSWGHKQGRREALKKCVSIQTPILIENSRNGGNIEKRKGDGTNKEVKEGLLEKEN